VPTTEKVQKKVSAAQGVGFEEPDCPGGSELLSRAASLQRSVTPQGTTI